MAIGYRIGERRELCQIGNGVERGYIEANVCNCIYLKTRIVGITVPWGQDIWLGATRGVLAECISCAFQHLT